MKTTRLTDGPVSYALIFEKNEEVMTSLQGFVMEHAFSASHFSGIGAFSDVTTGFFDRDAKKYLENHIHEQVEVLSLLGDVAWTNEGPRVHAHAVVGKRDGSAWGGHLLRGTVWPTLEVVITEAPAHLRRVFDPETGLALIGGDGAREEGTLSGLKKPVHRA